MIGLGGPATTAGLPGSPGCGPTTAPGGKPVIGAADRRTRQADRKSIPASGSATAPRSTAADRPPLAACPRLNHRRRLQILAGPITTGGTPVVGYGGAAGATCCGGQNWQPAKKTADVRIICHLFIELDSTSSLFRPRGHYFDGSFFSTAGGCRADVGFLLSSQHRPISQGCDQRHSPMKRQDAAGTPRLAFSGAESSVNRAKTRKRRFTRQPRKTAQSAASADRMLKPFPSPASSKTSGPAAKSLPQESTMTRLHFSSLSLIVVAITWFHTWSIRPRRARRCPHRPSNPPPAANPDAAADHSAAAVELQDRLHRSERQAHRSGRPRAGVARHSRTPAACRWKSASCFRCRTTARSTN